jgi:uncharacterized protein
MACYLDTSALVTLCVHEPMSTAVRGWYASTSEYLYTFEWTFTELASALGIKQRTGQISRAEAGAAWLRFARLCGHDLTVLQVAGSSFHKAADFARDPATKLRGGDALHVACTLAARIPLALTLDKKMARSMLQLNIALVQL